MGHNIIHCLLIPCTKKNAAYFCQKLKNHKKNQANSKWVTFYKVIALYSSKISRIWKTRKDCLRYKEPKKQCQPNVTCSPGLDLGPIKDIVGTTGGC